MSHHAASCRTVLPCDLIPPLPVARWGEQSCGHPLKRQPWLLWRFQEQGLKQSQLELLLKLFSDVQGKNASSTSESGGRGRSGGNLAGMDLLWQPEVSFLYFSTLHLTVQLTHYLVSGGPAIPQPTVQLLKPGDVGSSSRGDPEPVGVLLAAQHRHPRRREEGEGSPHPGRAAQDGGGQGGLRRRHRPQEPRHRPEE